MSRPLVGSFYYYYIGDNWMHYELMPKFSIFAWQYCLIISTPPLQRIIRTTKLLTSKPFSYEPKK